MVGQVVRWFGAHCCLSHPQGPGKGLLLKTPGVIAKIMLHGTSLWGTVEKCMGTLVAVCA